MDWNTGLKRISAVFWGFWALFFGSMIVGQLLGQITSADSAAYLFLTFPVLYALHRVNCWIIDGFFKRPQ